MCENVGRNNCSSPPKKLDLAVLWVCLDSLCLRVLRFFPGEQEPLLLGAHLERAGGLQALADPVHLREKHTHYI